MKFIVYSETPALGSYIHGCLEISEKGLKGKEIRKAAQRKTVEMLVSAGYERDKIGIQVSDYTSLEIGIHRVLIIPINEFDGTAASTLAALLR